MKYKWLIAFLFNTIVLLVATDYALAADINSVFKQKDLFSLDNFANPKEQVNIKLPLNSTSVSAAYTSKSFQQLQDGITELKFSSPLISLATDFTKDHYNLGISFNSYKINKVFPVLIKAGNLSFGGSLSRLNNPSLSTNITPFTNVTAEYKNITAGFSNPGTYTKPVSLFLQTSFNPNYSKHIESIEFTTCYYSKNLSLSLYSGFDIFKNSKVSFNSIIGTYSYNDKKLSSWFSDSFYYHEGNHLCMSNQFFFDSKHFKNYLYINSYESPFNSIQNTFLIEGSIYFPKYSFNYSFFYNPSEELLTSSDKVINSVFQFKINTQYKLDISQNFHIHNGLTVIADINLDENLHNIKVAAGTKLNFQKLQSTNNLIISGTIQNGNTDLIFEGQNYTFQSTNNFYISEIQNAIEIKAVFSCDKRDTVNSNYNFSYKIIYKPYFDIKNGVEVTFKENELQDIKINSTLNAKVQFRLYTLLFHLEFQV